MDNLNQAEKKYNCSNCLANGYIEKMNRICYKFNHKDKEVEFYVPYEKLSDGRLNCSEPSLNREELLEALCTYDNFIQNKPTFISLINAEFPFPDNVQREICPVGLVDEEDMEIIETESFCSAYSCLPYNGAMEDQPRRLIEAFNIVRGVKSEYEARKIKARTEGA